MLSFVRKTLVNVKYWVLRDLNKPFYVMGIDASMIHQAVFSVQMSDAVTFENRFDANVYLDAYRIRRTIPWPVYTLN